MGINSDIEYVDSTINPEMGCDGCELYNPKLPDDDPRQTCYANVWVSRFAGRSPSYPARFSKPELFPERIAHACRWPDLTGKARNAKPWLDGRPRVIFLNDLGDTFTESLPLDWLLPHMPQIEESPHVWLMFTKRPHRMADFFKLYGRVPANVWPVTSVTGPATLRRLDALRQIDSPRLCVSIEPLFADLNIRRHLADGRLAWVVTGFESGDNARPGSPNWARSLRDQCADYGTAFFFKQWGEYQPYDCTTEGGSEWDDRLKRVGKKSAGRLLDGRTWNEVPEVRA
jgi:protein gp37